MSGSGDNLPPELRALRGLIEEFRAAVGQNRLIPAATIRATLDRWQARDTLLALEHQFAGMGNPTDRHGFLVELWQLGSQIALARRLWEQEEKTLGRLAALGYALIVGGFAAVTFTAGPLVGIAYAAMGGLVAFGSEAKVTANMASAAASEELGRQIERIHGRLAALGADPANAGRKGE